MNEKIKADRRSRLADRHLLGPLTITMRAAKDRDEETMKLFGALLAEGLTDYFDKLDKLNYRPATNRSQA